MGLEFKSQIATTREQSEKLLALGLKPETADMVYHNKKSRIAQWEWELLPHTPTLRGKFWTPERIAKLKSPFHKHPDGSPMTGEEVFDSIWGKDIPAWSLSRLLELLPTQIKIGTITEDIFGLYHENNGEKWNLSYLGIQDFETESPFDSCIAAICWLIGNNKFNKEYLK